MIKSVLVLGAGSAGLMTALAAKKKLPGVSVRVVRDPVQGVIGVGESTTPNVPEFLFGYLGISPKHFYKIANPTWKIGIHFLWGPRPEFQYVFDRQLDARLMDLPMSNGFYCWDDFDYADLMSAMMKCGKAFPRHENGVPRIGGNHAFHLHNPDLVRSLEMIGTEWGIEYVDGTMESAERLPEGGVKAIKLKDGRRFEADLFIDASGFKSLLLGGVMGEPFESYGKSLFCDRAVTGGWERGPDEPIMPYTTAETMDAGWCWKIEHEKIINRGYVFCSAAMSDDEARAEFVRKNPKVKPWDHVIKFKSGRYRRSWVENVVGIGNAAGFVEPLEATALMVMTANVQTLMTVLTETAMEPTQTSRDLYNEVSAVGWDEIRDFLAIHYRFNTRLQTPFWKRATNEVDISESKEVLEFYQENGPLGLLRHVLGNRGQQFGLHNAFGVEGYLVILTGCKVPYTQKYKPTEREWAIWREYKRELMRQASMGMTPEEAMAYVRHPSWQWHADVLREQEMAKAQAKREPQLMPA